MTGEHRPKHDSESQTTKAYRADLTRGEIGAGAVVGPSPLADASGARASRVLRHKSAGLTT
jgi:hypothetical protein